MFASLKRWLSSATGAVGEPAFGAVEAWALTAGFRYRHDKDAQRFMVEATSGAHALRLEWGPSQRDYITPNELRLRLDLNLPGSLQMMVMSRPLAEKLEAETFERSTQAAQTVIDMSTPEEVRWLAMFSRADLALDKSLRARLCVVGAEPRVTADWVRGPLAAQLANAAQSLLAGDPPFVLMTMRGKLYLRMQIERPDPSALSECIELFDAAAQSALALIGQVPPDDADWPSSASTGWQSQAALDVEPADRLRRN
jgi:hypothetical protein